MSTPYTTTWTFGSITASSTPYYGLSFTSIVSNETDYGTEGVTFGSFTDTAFDPFEYNAAGVVGIEWSSFQAWALGPGALTRRSPASSRTM